MTGPKSSRASQGRARGRGRRTRRAPLTLAIDIGGSSFKAAVLDPQGRMVTRRRRVEPHRPLTRESFLRDLEGLARRFDPYHRVSVGFPGVVRHGVILTAVNLSTPELAGLDLDAWLEETLDRPARVVNDADMQGLAAIVGRGVEMVVTLGTGFGTAIFVDGQLGPHLELAHHPFRAGRTYEQLLGEAARARLGVPRWLAHLEDAIGCLRALTHFDMLHLGGGNARFLREIELAPDVRVVPNRLGILGGIRLWEPRAEPAVRLQTRSTPEAAATRSRRKRRA